ncbi:MAG: aminotransferase class V-fold PLP-dependent enzyme, partial [Planctomycetota bacterium]
MSDFVYLDANATTRPDPKVVEAMLPFLTEHWANPSSVHTMGQRARAAIDEARSRLAALIGCRDTELTFTGGGTEATATALRGLAATRKGRIVTTAVEHSATLELCAEFERTGREVVRVGVDELGRLNLGELADALGGEVAFATTIWANNETGVLFDVAEIARLCKEHRVPYHCDATQTVGKLPVNFHELGLDCATLAVHKFHGPKGVGVLYTRRGLRIPPLMLGSQERDRRGGTENVAGIVGAGVAATLAAEHLPAVHEVAALRDELERRVCDAIEHVRVNGDIDHRLPNT